MSVRKVYGVVMLVIGIVAFGLSMYIRDQVDEGREKVSSAQRRLDQGNSLFNLTPFTKQIGKGVTGGAQNKINEGILQIQKYNDFAAWLQVGGIVFMVVGAGIAIIAKRK